MIHLRRPRRRGGGEIDGRITPRVTAIRDRWHDFDPRRDRDAQHLGYLWGKEATAPCLRHRGDQRVDSPTRSPCQPIDRSTSPWRARSWPSRGPNRSARGDSTGFDGPAAYLSPHPPARRSARSTRLVAHNGARPSRTAASGGTCGAQAAQRSRRAARHRGHLGGEVGVPAPLTARLVALIHEIERGARPQSLDALDALAAAPFAPRSPHEPGLHRKDRQSSPGRRTDSGGAMARRFAERGARVWRVTCSMTSCARRKRCAATQGIVFAR